MTDIKKFMDIVSTGGADEGYAKDSKAVMFGLLLKTAEDMGKVIEMLKTREGAIEPWLQSKVSTASALISDVHDFLSYSVGDYAATAVTAPPVPAMDPMAGDMGMDPMAGDMSVPPMDHDNAVDVVDAEVAEPVAELPPLPGDEDDFAFDKAKVVPESFDLDSDPVEEDFLTVKKPTVSKERMNQVVTPRDEKPEASEWGGKGFFSFRDFERQSQAKQKFSKK